MDEIATHDKTAEPGEMEQVSSLQAILKLAEAHNLCDQIEERELAKIGQDVVKLARLDDDSRDEWLKKSEKAMEAALQITEQKSEPWQGASNVKHPGITIAALQFHARAYPAIVQPGKVVKGKVTGQDEQGQKAAHAKRVAAHMNYQLLDENEDWEEDVDKMLLALPIEGCEFKKSYFDPDKGINVSEWVRPENLIVHDKTKSLTTCPRATHRLFYYPYEIDGFMRSGAWSDAELRIDTEDQENETQQEFYEQHTYLDLDDDGYKEPYIVTVHVKSQQVVRIRAGFHKESIKVKFQDIVEPLPVLLAFLKEKGAEGVPEGVEVVSVDRVQMFTKYGFIPSPDGSFYDIGFGQLAGPLNDTVDTVINQLLDAGTLSNTAGGFVRDGVSVEGKRGPIKWVMGQFKRVKAPASQNLADAIYQLKFPEPSNVLFQLLGAIIQMEKDVTGTQDIMLGGNVPEGQPATTTIAQIEQGMKIYSAIYKRVYRSLKQELKKLYKLNGRYLKPEQYFQTLDTQEAAQVGLADYQNDGTDIQPVADPQAATTLLTMAKAQALLPLKGDPGVDSDAINEFYIKSLDVPAPDSFIIPPEKRQQGPDPKMQLDVMKAADQHIKTQAEIVKLYAEAIQKLADAEAKEAGAQIGIYTAQVQGLRQIIDGFNQGRDTGMEGATGNQGGFQVPPQMPPGIS